MGIIEYYLAGWLATCIFFDVRVMPSVREKLSSSFIERLIGIIIQLLLHLVLWVLVIIPYIVTPDSIANKVINNLEK